MSRDGESDNVCSVIHSKVSMLVKSHNFEMKRRLLPLLLVSILPALSGPLETFKGITEGSLPIYKAEVKRDVILPNGNVSSPDLFMMGWSSLGGTSNSWFFSPSRDFSIPPGGAVLGESLTHVWFFTDTHIQVAEKSVASGSWPEKDHVGIRRPDITSAATMGLDENESLTWSGLSFTGSPLTPGGPRREGQIVERDILGRPVLIHVSDRTNRYEYGGTNWIPSLVTSSQGDWRIRIQFIEIETNTVNIAAGGGYTPSMFLDPAVARSVYFWTNSESFGVVSETGQTWANRQEVAKSPLPFWILTVVSITALASIIGWWWKSRSK